MSTPSSPAASAGTTNAGVQPKAWAMEHLKTLSVPYYLTLAGVLGALTVGFVVVIVLLIIVVANFNVLGLIE